MTSPHFGPEIWLCVFDELAQGRTRLRDLKAAALVCKAWNALATAGIYRTVTVTESSLCMKLVACLIYSCLLNNDPAQSTRHISLCHEQPVGDSAMCTLLSFFRDLRTFDHLCRTNYLVLFDLWRSSAMTLQSMTVVLGDEPHILPDAIDLIGRMTNLRRLHIHLCTLYILTEDVCTALPPLVLPRLEDLAYGSPQDKRSRDCCIHGHVNHFEYLSRCNFPSLERFAFVQTSLKDIPAKVLEPFFLRHSARLRYLALKGVEDVGGLPHMLSDLPDLRIAILEFRGPVETAVLEAFLHMLPTSVTGLCLDLPELDDYFQQYYFWRHLDAIALAIANKKVAINRVLLTSSIPFTWASIRQLEHPHAPFGLYRTLRGHVSYLAARNVAVLDSTGEEGP